MILPEGEPHPQPGWVAFFPGIEEDTSPDTMRSHCQTGLWWPGTTNISGSLFCVSPVPLSWNYSRLFPLLSLTHSLVNAYLFCSQPKATTFRKPLQSLTLSQVCSSMIPQTFVPSIVWTEPGRARVGLP